MTTTTTTTTMMITMTMMMVMVMVMVMMVMVMVMVMVMAMVMMVMMMMGVMMMMMFFSWYSLFFSTCQATERRHVRRRVGLQSARLECGSPIFGLQWVYPQTSSCQLPSGTVKARIDGVAVQCSRSILPLDNNYSATSLLNS